MLCSNSMDLYKVTQAHLIRPRIMQSLRNVLDRAIFPTLVSESCPKPWVKLKDYFIWLYPHLLLTLYLFSFCYQRGYIVHQNIIPGCQQHHQNHRGSLPLDSTSRPPIVYHTYLCYTELDPLSFKSNTREDVLLRICPWKRLRV